MSLCYFTSEVKFDPLVRIFYQITIFLFGTKRSSLGWSYDYPVFQYSSPNNFNIYEWSLLDSIITVMVTEWFSNSVLFFTFTSWHSSVQQCFSFFLLLYFSIMDSFFFFLNFFPKTKPGASSYKCLKLFTLWGMKFYI